MDASIEAARAAVAGEVPDSAPIPIPLRDPLTGEPVTLEEHPGSSEPELRSVSSGGS